MNYPEEERKQKRKKELEEYRRIVSYEIPSSVTELHPKKKKRFFRTGNLIMAAIIICTAFSYFYAGKQLSDTHAANKELEKELSASGDRIASLTLELEAVKAYSPPEDTASTKNAPLSSDSFTVLYPLTAGSVILHPYGSYTSADGADSFCYGMDLQTEPDARVIAAGSGTILFAGEDEETGLTIRIDHGNGFQTQYCYLRELQAAAGQTVTAGDCIAFPDYADKEDLSHMEFRITCNGTYINPEDVMKING